MQERKRRVEHIVPVGFALLLRVLSWQAAAALAGVSVLYAVFVSPRLVTDTLRADEARRGFSYAKLMYGVMALVLILLFRHRMHVAAGAWAIMALGDGFAGLAGRARGARRLPWNREKSWAGTLAFFAAGGAGCAALLRFVSARYPAPVALFPEAIAAAFLAAAVAAAVESLPSRLLEDNVTVPASAAIVLSLIV